MKERFFIIGTSGHVDHGKSQLIHALTGISTDRLKEEKERGISIELGYAYLTLPDGRKAGIVDVPGHEKFVRQMLAGASGMDMVLLVIAADEGIMPQTKEHLDILTLLEVNKGIVVLNKMDLVDQEWLEMMEQEIKDGLKDSILAEAPICRVSAVTGEGIKHLFQTINDLLEQTESRKIDGPARMPIDRVFTSQGFGTIVTGTLSSGTIRKGEDLCIEPGGRKVKIRNLQIHGEQTDKAYAGQRTAINLSGIAVSDIPRGVNLVYPNSFKSSQILDLQLWNLPRTDKVISQRQRVRFHIGTAEVLGRIHLLDQEELLPGKAGLAQIILEEPVLAAREDRFVIRFYSPVITIAGGRVLGVAPYKRKRFKDSVLKELKLKAEGNKKDILMEALSSPLSVVELMGKTGTDRRETEQQIIRLREEGLIINLNEDNTEIYWAVSSASSWAQAVAAMVLEYEKKYPLNRGIGREELRKSRFGMNLSLKRWQNILEWGFENKYYKVDGNQISSINKTPLPKNNLEELNCLIDAWDRAGMNPPDLGAGAIDCGIDPEKIIQYAGYLVREGKWLLLGEVYFSQKQVDIAKDILAEYLKQNGQITAAEARDLWRTSRKYALPVLEYLDSIKLTKRDGLVRYLSE